MEASDFLKKYKIKKVYAYHEEKSDESISFGWIASKKINLNNSVVVSTVSKSKNVSDNDKDWARLEGNSVASLDDYNKYFQSLTGGTPDDFIKAWGVRPEALELSRQRDNDKYRDGEGEFILSLANLLSNGKKFSKFGRVYKIIDTNS
jgi:hypothetical protein